MEQIRFFLPVSAWYVLLCVAAGAVYAWLLYTKKAPWSKSLNYGLAALRWSVVSIIAFFLLNPLIKQANTIVEKPLWIVAIDNSESVAATMPTDSLQKIQNKLQDLSAHLQNQEANVAVHTLNQMGGAELGKIKFDRNSTDINAMLSELQSTYENRNLSGVLLVSDGIVNTGISPVYQSYNFKIHSLGLGDTIPKTDIAVRALYFNKIAYWGNKFPLKAEIQQSGFTGKTVNVRLKHNGKVIENQKVTLKNAPTEVNFMVTASDRGLQRLVVEVVPQASEFTTKNNTANAYIEVVDGREKILLAAAAPHPDIKAIKSAIEKESNYELVTYIYGIDEFKEARYDLVILHQLPDLNNTATAFVERWVNDKTTPVWFILGSQSNVAKVSSMNDLVKIAGRQGQTDKVTASFSADFKQFIYEIDKQAILAKLPPLTVPYGEYLTTGSANIILRQQVGTLATEKPILAVSANSQAKKSAIWLGEGLWHWRLQEFADTKSHVATDALIRKLVQYLSAKDDKRKFRVYPLVTELFESEKVTFEAETYNNIYEKVYNQTVDLRITSENQKKYQYSFVTGENASRFEVGSLPHGIYKYVATTQLNGKTEKSEGAFLVKEQQLETVNTTADFALLRELAQQNGGQFFKAQHIDQLAAYLQQNKAKSLIRSDEQVLELINLRWIFFLLLALFSTEWLLRKWKGSY